MKIFVGVKRVVDYAAKVRVLPDKSGVDLGTVKMSLNPFCEIAVEEAIRLKEKKIAREVVAVTVGPKSSQEVLRTALAMGADRAIHVQSDMRLDQELQPMAVARTFEKLAKKEGDVDLIILGKQSIDGDNCATGPMLGAFLGWPQCTFAANLTFGSKIDGERETDTGTEDISFPIPAVITTDLRLNEPRYPTLPNIMKAKKKQVEIFTAEDLDINFTPKNVIIEVNDPPVRQAGVTVEDVDNLLDKLKNEAKVI